MKRNYVIDFLRFVAILMVLVSHAELQDSQSFFNNITSAGFLGVELFFVLSGFLVSGLIITEYDKFKSFYPKLFLIRRGFKIYPAYYIFIAAASIYQLFVHRFSIKGLLCDFFFLSNYTHASGRAWLWSLSLEEHFYIFLCLLFFFLIKFNQLNWRNLLKVYATLLIISFSSRIYNYINYPPDWRRDVIVTHSRMDSLFWGVLLYYAYYYKNTFYKFIMSHKNIFLYVSILFLLTNYTFIRENRIISLVYLSLNSVFFGFVIIIALNKESLNKNIIIKKLSFIGKYSYSIYLLHGSFGLIIPKLQRIFFSNVFYLIVYLFICCSCGIIFSKLVEIPFLKMRNKYFPSRSQSLI